MPKYDVTLEGRAIPVTITADSFRHLDHWVSFIAFDEKPGVTVAAIPEHQVVVILRVPEPKPATDSDAGTITATLKLDTTDFRAQVGKIKADLDALGSRLKGDA